MSNVAATDEMFSFAKSLVNETLKNVDLLERETGLDEINAVLYKWAIVQAVLSAEVLDSVISLLQLRQFRSSAILVRSLLEYGVRLTYYVVQARDILKTNAPHSAVDLSAMKLKIDAVKDWSESNYALGKKLAKYDPEYWTDEHRDEIAKMSADPTKATFRHAPVMLDWLEHREHKVRGVLPFLVTRQQQDHRNKRAEWHNASVYAHGDQAVISNVIEQNVDGTLRTVNRHQVDDTSIVLLFSAIRHVAYLNQAIAELRGWSFGSEGAMLAAGALFRDRPRTSVDLTRCPRP